MSFIKKTMSKYIYYLLTIISPKFNTQMRFLYLTKSFANLKNPSTFSEKLSWLKLNTYSQSSLVKMCSDKYLVRDYIEKNGYSDCLNNLIGVYNSSNEIEYASLPNRFVLKLNFGCGFNILCKDKNNIDNHRINKTLDSWMREPYWLKYGEMQYKISQKKILCEEYINFGKDLIDYKFYCFHGIVEAILVIQRNDDNDAAVFMDRYWNIISTNLERYSASFSPSKPIRLDDMIDMAEKLSKPFPFVRVDLYHFDNRIVFGEMTFTPATGILPSETSINGKMMGDLLDISKYIKGEKNVD